jgi:hypothetical protein
MEKSREENMTQYEEIGAQIGRLLEKKQWAYGHAFDHMDEVLKIFFPNGIPPEKYPILLATIRMFDKHFRTTTGKDDSNEDPWADIAGYAILMMVKMRSLKK